MNKPVILLLSVIAAVSLGCEKVEPQHRPEDENYERVMIYYGCGQNNLDDNMQVNQRELIESEGAYVPGTGDGNALVLIHHSLPESKAYAVSGPTDITWIYRDSRGNIVRDTIAEYKLTTTADAAVMKDLLGYVKNRFKSKHYGIVFSSHGTGWMPQGSYDTEDSAEEFWACEPKQPETMNSFGQERVGFTDYFMDIPDMAAGFPMKMDYILFDACLMGGVEVAYELHGVTPRIGFSQAEISTHGFAYNTMSRRLLEENNPKAVIEDTYNYYESRNSTCVISYIDCDRLDAVAEASKTLISSYRDAIGSVNPDEVQQFFRNGHHWFYDLEDIFVQSGIPAQELEALHSALDGCVLYKAHSRSIFGSVTVRTHCGFSMFLPCDGSEYLKKYYRTLAWNKATGLVE